MRAKNVLYSNFNECHRTWYLKRRYLSSKRNSMTVLILLKGLMKYYGGSRPELLTYATCVGRSSQRPTHITFKNQV